MDLPWGDERSKKFVTNVGLVTSNGPLGDDIMACEWTHHVSYSPGLIVVCIRSGDATHENIKQTEEFGVSLCAVDQSVMSSVAGGYSGRNYDKIKALKELGFEFYSAKTIKTLMVKGAAMNAECKMVNEYPLGDHTMFVGEILEASNNPDKEPLGFYGGRYWIMDRNVVKPSQEERERVRSVVEKFKK